LWEREEELVNQELLNIMDEMQRAMLAVERNEKPKNLPENDATEGNDQKKAV